MFAVYLALTRSPDLRTKTDNVLGANTRSVSARFCDSNWEKGKDFVKNFLHQKTFLGEGEEHERALDDVFAIWVTVRSCWEKRIKTKLCKSR